MEAVLVSDSYFEVLDVPPLLGRTLEPDDDRSASPAVVLAHAFWRSAFGSSREVLGQRVNLGGIEYTVAGVLPRGFNGHSAERVDVWAPLAAAMQSRPGWDHDPYTNIVSVVVRLKDGVSNPAVSEGASAALGRTVRLQPVGGGADVSRIDRQVAVGVTALSLLVVVLALANTATLLLVRGARRRRELGEPHGARRCDETRGPRGGERYCGRGLAGRSMASLLHGTSPADPAAST